MAWFSRRCCTNPFNRDRQVVVGWLNRWFRSLLVLCVLGVCVCLSLASIFTSFKYGRFQYNFGENLHAEDVGIGGSFSSYFERVSFPESERCRSRAIADVFCPSSFSHFGVNNMEIVNRDGYFFDVAVARPEDALEIGNGSLGRGAYATGFHIEDRALVVHLVASPKKSFKYSKIGCWFLKHGLDAMGSVARESGVVLLSTGKYGDGSVFPFMHLLDGIDGCSSQSLWDFLDDRRLVAWVVMQHKSGKPSAPAVVHRKLRVVPLGVNSNIEHTIRATLCATLVAPFQPAVCGDLGGCGRNEWLYVNFNTEANNVGSLRRDALLQTSHALQHMQELVYTENHLLYNSYKTDTLSYLRSLARSKFVLSPPGTGSDCFRHWEALLFGAIPILDPVFPQFDDDVIPNLPVLRPPNGNWSLLTPEQLRQADQNVCALTSDPNWPRRLTQDFWNEFLLKLARTRNPTIHL